MVKEMNSLDALVIYLPISIYSVSHNNISPKYTTFYKIILLLTFYQVFIKQMNDINISIPCM